jgi:hypothetical protein
VFQRTSWEMVRPEVWERKRKWALFSCRALQSNKSCTSWRKFTNHFSSAFHSHVLVPQGYAPARCSLFLGLSRYLFMFNPELDPVALCPHKSTT